MRSYDRQPVLADEVQTFKALITIHKVLQEGHPIVVREAQQHANWVDSLMRGVAGEGIRGMRVSVGRSSSPPSPPYSTVGSDGGDRLWTTYTGIRFLPRVEASVP